MKNYFAMLVTLIFLPVFAWADIEPTETLTYKTIDDVVLKLHVFKPDGHTPSDNRPAIMFFFGGGYTGGTVTQFYPQSEYLASRGMVAITVDYRVESRHGTSPKEAIMDGLSAIRWVRTHADELGINPTMIAAGGGSAGAHLAAVAGTTHGFDDPSDDLSVSSRPNATVLFNPVVDNSPSGWGHEKVKDYWEALSPLHNLSKSTPPTIFFLGTNDRLIPVSVAKKYKRAMEENGTRCDLFLYQDQPHGFFNKLKYDETLFEMDRFLVSLGYLDKDKDLLHPSPAYLIQ